LIVDAVGKGIAGGQGVVDGHTANVCVVMRDSVASDRGPIPAIRLSPVSPRRSASQIPKTKVPLRGPSASQMTFEGTDLGLGAARLCSLLRPSQTHRSLA